MNICKPIESLLTYKKYIYKTCQQSNKSSVSLWHFLEASFTQNRAPQRKLKLKGGGWLWNRKKALTFFFNSFSSIFKILFQKDKNNEDDFFSLKFNLHTCNLTPLYWFDTVIDNKIRMRFLTFVVDKSVRIYRW